MAFLQLEDGFCTFFQQLKDFNAKLQTEMFSSPRFRCCLWNIRSFQIQGESFCKLPPSGEASFFAVLSTKVKPRKPIWLFVAVLSSSSRPYYLVIESNIVTYFEQVPGLLKVRHIGQTTLGSAAVFGLFLGVGSGLHCGKTY
jgi:hypothetical protein